MDLEREDTEGKGLVKIQLDKNSCRSIRPDPCDNRLVALVSPDFSLLVCYMLQ